MNSAIMDLIIWSNIELVVKRTCPKSFIHMIFQLYFYTVELIFLLGTLKYSIFSISKDNQKYLKSSYITRTSKGGYAAAAQDGSYQPISKKSYKLLGIYIKDLIYQVTIWTKSNAKKKIQYIKFFQIVTKQLIEKPKLKSSKQYKLMKVINTVFFS